MSTAEIPFDEMCHHALQSCKVNGLRPKEWRWGRDAITAFRRYSVSSSAAHGSIYAASCFHAPVSSLPKGALLIWQDLPVYPMQASGVACVAH